MSRLGGVSALRMVVVGLWLATTIACRPAPSASPAPTPVVIKAIALPDLANAAAPMQQLVRDRFAAAQRAGTSPTPDPARARAYGELGMALMAAEYLREAETSLQNAEALAPGEMRWPYYLGHLYRTRGEARKSVAAFERAVKADASYPPAFVWLGNAYLDQGRPEDADAQFGKALATDPRMVAALLGRGRAALARNDFPTAITHLERALTIDPDARALQMPLALAYRGAGQADKAKQHLQPQGSATLRPPDPIYEEVELLAETPVAFELRGAHAMSEGRYDEAISALEKGVALAPNEPALRHKLATALALKGDLPAALKVMRETVTRSPMFAKGHYSLGLLYLQVNDPRHAAAAFEDALRVEPAYVEPRLQLAHLLRRTSQSAASLPHYAKLMELDSRVAEARFGYAMALVDARRFADARDQLTQGTQMFPDQPAFVLALARILSAAPDAAVRDGQRALDLLRPLPQATQQTVEFGVVTAMALAETGRYDDAASLQQQVLDQLPLGTEPRIRQRLTESLSSYRQRRPLRRPWADVEAMEME